MSLNLDARQRAMLQEMGITIWWPKPAAAAVAAPVPVAQAAAMAVAQAPVQATATAVVDAPATAAPAAAAAITAPAAAPQPVPATAPARPAPTPAPAVAQAPENAVQDTAWRITPAVQAYPAATGGSADDAWLVICESPNPGAPLEGDTGKLLNNMLRALRLHHSPHVWIACMQRPGHEALPALSLPQTPVDWQDLPAGLAANVRQTRPARMLLLGMQPARAVLHSQEALGRLRAQVHQVHDVPTVVSYDPAYLLRAPHAKPAAWADLCRAHALRPPPAL